MWMKRIGWSSGLATLLVLAVFVNAWFLDSRFVLPLLPGEYVGAGVKWLLRGSGGIGFYQILFLVANIVFWTLLLLGMASIVSRFRANHRGADH